MGSSLQDLRAFTPDAKTRLGTELRRVQWGGPPRDWKPMKTVGTGVIEIRVHAGIELLIYIARFEEAIYVLHAFEKRSQKTSPRDVDIARRRLAEVLLQRGGG